MTDVVASRIWNCFRSGQSMENCSSEDYAGFAVGFTPKRNTSFMC